MTARIADTGPRARRIDPRTVADALGAKMEAPILFSAEMVRAILEGRKTQTRRIEKRPRLAKMRKGDLLWVRETWAPCDQLENGDNAKFGFTYRADWSGEEECIRDFPWRPSIHMLRRASRITLELTADPRFERLQKIDWRGARAEGIPVRDQYWSDMMIAEFEELWDSINAGKPGCSWSSNPEVLVLEFRRVKP